MKKRYNLETFIKRANEIHRNIYDYSLTQQFKTTEDKLKIKCNIHGVFEQSPHAHLRGQGCPKCGRLKANKSESYNNEIFIKKANNIHNNKYDYSLVSYKGSGKEVIIICPEHGQFLQKPVKHLLGHGCKKCNNNKRWEKQKLTQEQFIAKANSVHYNKYNYSLTKYNKSDEKIIIICPIHGEFEQIPNRHLAKCGCPKCKSSRGEIKIRNFLNQNNIKYNPQKKFQQCKIKRMLPFDFYLPDYNLCIEFQGKQHYIVSWGGEERLKLVQEHDKVKKEFCQQNDIILLTIKYNEDIICKLNQYLFCGCN
jgi:hypothetical protein